MTITLEAFKEKGKKLLLEPEKTVVATEEKITGSSPLKDPPNILMFRRKAIRVFPDGKRVALYYSSTVDKTLALPYGGDASHEINLTNIQEGFSLPKRIHDPSHHENPYHKHLVADPENHIYQGSHNYDDGSLTHYYAKVKSWSRETGAVPNTKKQVMVDKDEKGKWSWRRGSESHKLSHSGMTTDYNGKIQEEAKPKKKASSAKSRPKKKEEPKKNELTGVLGKIQKVFTNPDLNGMPLKFKDGSTGHIDKMTSIAIMNIHDKLGDLGKANLHKNINKSKHHYEKIAAFAHGYHSDRDVDKKGKK